MPYVAYKTNTHQCYDRETGIYKHAHIDMPSRDGMINLSDDCLLLELMAYDLIP